MSHHSLKGNTQGQVGWRSEKSDQAGDVPAHCMIVGLEDL